MGVSIIPQRGVGCGATGWGLIPHHIPRCGLSGLWQPEETFWQTNAGSGRKNLGRCELKRWGRAWAASVQPRSARNCWALNIQQQTREKQAFLASLSWCSWDADRWTGKGGGHSNNTAALEARAGPLACKTHEDGDSTLLIFESRLPECYLFNVCFLAQ